MRLYKCDECALRPSHLRDNFSSKAGRGHLASMPPPKQYVTKEYRLRWQEWSVTVTRQENNLRNPDRSPKGFYRSTA